MYKNLSRNACHSLSLLIILLQTEHLRRCEAWNRERKELIEKMKSLVAVFDEEEEERRLALISDLTCKKGSIERCVEKVWAA